MFWVGAPMRDIEEVTYNATRRTSSRTSTRTPARTDPLALAKEESHGSKPPRRAPGRLAVMTAPMNYTTQIAAQRTVNEMQKMLAEYGASQITMAYRNGQPSGLSFVLDTPHGPRHFELPVDIEAMHRLLKREYEAHRLKSLPRSKAFSMEHASRVGWRVMKEWLAAQLTLIETQMVAPDQILLPFLVVNDQGTLYDSYKQHELKALGS